MASQLTLPLGTHALATGRDGDVVRHLVPLVVEESFKELSVFEANNLMHMHVKRGSSVDARHVFDSMARRNVVSWNIMILAYAKLEEAARALELYARMYQEGFQANARTFVGTFKACSSMAALEDGEQVDGKCVKIGSLGKGRAIHSRVVNSGFESNAFVRNILVDMYMKCGSMQDAWRVFGELPHRDVITWTTMILACAEQGDGALAMELYVQMYQEGVQPNDRTFVGALKACSSQAELAEGSGADKKSAKTGFLEKGRAMHSQVIKSGFESDVFVGNTLVSMYAKCGSMEDAWVVFEELPYDNVVAWNTMILGYAEQEEEVLALELYTWMHQEGVQPDARTFVGTLKACSSLATQEEFKQGGKVAKLGSLGKGFHSQIIKNGFDSDVFLGTTLVYMYTKCRSVEDARRVFDMLPERDVFTWTSLIVGYAEQEETEKAFVFYSQMQEQGVPPNSVTIVAILKACGNTAALETGKDLHTYVSTVGFETFAIVGTSLIDMYAKCASMADAQLLFDSLPTRDIVTWSVLSAGYVRQGESEYVLHLFEKMRQEGIQPNGLTFVNILTVCSHAGLVEKGQGYFQAMDKQYGIVPTIEHYTCMVDLLGRVGRVNEAVAMVEKVPFQPDVVVWLTVLGACRKWNNIEAGRCAFQNLVRSDARLPAAAYILMSNLYADVEMWEDYDKVQSMRESAESKEDPGQIWWTDLIHLGDGG